MASNVNSQPWSRPTRISRELTFGMEYEVLFGKFSSDTLGGLPLYPNSIVQNGIDILAQEEVNTYFNSYGEGARSKKYGPAAQGVTNMLKANQFSAHP